MCVCKPTEYAFPKYHCTSGCGFSNDIVVYSIREDVLRHGRGKVRPLKCRVNKIIWLSQKKPANGSLIRLMVAQVSMNILKDEGRCKPRCITWSQGIYVELFTFSPKVHKRDHCSRLMSVHCVYIPRKGTMHVHHTGQGIKEMWVELRVDHVSLVQVTDDLLWWLGGLILRPCDMRNTRRTAPETRALAQHSICTDKGREWPDIQ